MKSLPKLLAIFLVLFTFSANPLYAEEKVDSTKTSSTKKQVIFELTDFAGNDIKKLSIGKKYRVELGDTNRSDLFVYINAIRVDSLEPLRNQPGFYSFILPEKDLDGGLALYKLLEDEKQDADEEKVLVRFGIGTSPKNLLISKKNVVIDVHDSKREAGKFIIFFAMISVSLFTMYILFRDQQRILRDHGVSGKLAPYSLARTQMAFWTVIILISIFWIWYDQGIFVEITSQVLVLIGISAGTTITANLIDNADLKDASITTRHQDTSSSNNILLNIVSDQNGLSIHRFQNVIFSMAIGCYFLFEVFTNSKIPTLNENLMVLMGISASTYLAIKKGENSSLRDEIKTKEAADAEAAAKQKTKTAENTEG